MDPPSFVVKPGSETRTPTKKYNSGQNKSGNPNAKKMDDPDFVPGKIAMDKSKEITQTRNAKGLTRKDLATRASVSVKVVEEIETGKAVKTHPDYQKNINKIYRALGIHVQKKKQPKKPTQSVGKK